MNSKFLKSEAQVSLFNGEHKLNIELILLGEDDRSSIGSEEITIPGN